MKGKERDVTIHFVFCGFPRNLWFVSWLHETTGWSSDVFLALFFSPCILPLQGYMFTHKQLCSDIRFYFQKLAAERAGIRLSVLALITWSFSSRTDIQSQFVFVSIC